MVKVKISDCSLLTSPLLGGLEFSPEIVIFVTLTNNQKTDGRRMSAGYDTEPPAIGFYWVNKHEIFEVGESLYNFGG